MNASKKDRLGALLAVIKENNITAYEIGNGTGLNISGINKILTEKTQNPTNSTLKILEDFIAQRLLGSHKNNPLVAEPAPVYKTGMSPEEIIENQLKLIHLLENENKRLTELSSKLLEEKKEWLKKN